MKYYFKCLAMALLLLCVNPVMAMRNPTVIWTAVFSHVMPINNQVSQQYCLTHTPTVMVTTIKQITSQRGVRALNGIWVKYLSYKTVERDHLYFNLVNAVVSGRDDQGKTWSEPMKLYEQTLMPVGVTDTVWSTPHCKGMFLGTPTSLHKSSLPVQTGDLLFQRLNCGAFCRAVNQTRWGADHQRVTHVGMVINANRKPIEVIQADFNGVALVPLATFLKASHGHVMLGRLKAAYRYLIPQAVQTAKGYVGKPYNFSFRPNGRGLYCSQLISRAFQEANDGKPFFKPIHMTFKDKKTGRYFPEWIAYYKKLGESIPENALGSNPAELSRSDKIQIISET